MIRRGLVVSVGHTLWGPLQAVRLWGAGTRACCVLIDSVPLPLSQVIINRQEDQLNKVGASVHTLKKMGEAIGDELDDQQM